MFTGVGKLVGSQFEVPNDFSKNQSCLPTFPVYREHSHLSPRNLAPVNRNISGYISFLPPVIIIDGTRRIKRLKKTIARNRERSKAERTQQMGIQLLLQACVRENDGAPRSVTGKRQSIESTDGVTKRPAILS
jgi:hypothetical protein